MKRLKLIAAVIPTLFAAGAQAGFQLIEHEAPPYSYQLVKTHEPKAEVVTKRTVLGYTTRMLHEGVKPLFHPAVHAAGDKVALTSAIETVMRYAEPGWTVDARGAVAARKVSWHSGKPWILSIDDMLNSANLLATVDWTNKAIRIYDARLNPRWTAALERLAPETTEIVLVEHFQKPPQQPAIFSMQMAPVGPGSVVIGHVDVPVHTVSKVAKDGPLATGDVPAPVVTDNSPTQLSAPNWPVCETDADRFKKECRAFFERMLGGAKADAPVAVEKENIVKTQAKAQSNPVAVALPVASVSVTQAAPDVAAAMPEVSQAAPVETVQEPAIDYTGMTVEEIRAAAEARIDERLRAERKAFEEAQARYEAYQAWLATQPVRDEAVSAAASVADEPKFDEQYISVDEAKAMQAKAEAARNAVFPVTAKSVPLDKGDAVNLPILSANSNYKVIQSPKASWSVMPEDGSLRGTLSRWSAVSGYRLKWNASGDVRVKSEAAYYGTFEQALRTLERATGKSIKANEIDRTVTVND